MSPCRFMLNTHPNLLSPPISPTVPITGMPPPSSLCTNAQPLPNLTCFTCPPIDSRSTPSPISFPHSSHQRRPSRACHLPLRFVPTPHAPQSDSFPRLIHAQCPCAPPHPLVYGTMEDFTLPHIFQVDSARVQVIFWSPPGVQVLFFGWEPY